MAPQLPAVDLADYLAGDLVTVAWIDAVADAINYLGRGGALLTAAATIVITNEFHALQGVTTVNTITHANPRDGQIVSFWISSAGGLSFGVAGNILTVSGVASAYPQHAIASFIYFGGTWLEVLPCGDPADLIGSASQIFAHGVLSKNAADGIGYSAGAGGTVTQLTSKATGVTINTVTGRIVMNAAALAAGAVVAFNVTNSAINPGDAVIVTIGAVGVTQYLGYRVEVSGMLGGAGPPTGFNIRITNVTAGSLSEAVPINFVIVRGSLS